MIRYLFNKLLNKPAADFLQRFSSDQSKIIQNYITNYHRKLQLIDAFGKEWDEGEIKRLRTEIEKIMRIDVSEENIVSNQTKSVRKAVDEIGCVLKNEINQKNRKSEEEIDKDLISLNSKLQVLDKNLKLQEKWFEKNKNVFEQNKHKDELINLIRREGSTLFDVESTDIHDLIEKTTHDADV